MRISLAEIEAAIYFEPIKETPTAHLLLSSLLRITGNIFSNRDEGLGLPVSFDRLAEETTSFPFGFFVVKSPETVDLLLEFMA